MRPIVFIVVFAAVSAAATVQVPLSVPPARGVVETIDEYQFKWPIRRVAVIGAGSSGIVAYRELTEVGIEARVFERDSVPGGNWCYTEQVPLDAPVPNAPSATADFVPSLPLRCAELPCSEVFGDDAGEVWRDHRAPKAIWESLRSNAPSPQQQLPQWPWPAGTKWRLSQYQLRNYVRSYASFLNINSNDRNPAISYSTRVERVEKRVNGAGEEQGWRLWLKSLRPIGSHTYNATWWTEDFDAVVVAVGKYNAPSMPSIPGLDAWVRALPDLVRHSRQYRRPEAYANQSVLIVGASVSGSEISIDLNRHVRQVYQSFRPDTERRRHNRLENYMSRLPENTTVIGEINRFLPLLEGSPIQSGLVELKNGTIVSGFDSVILATGFRYSFPFLPQYYDGADFVPHEGSTETVSPFIPSDGSYVRDLYLDLFYIGDPTLAFTGMTLGTQTFILSDYTSLALAKVWTNTAKLPSVRTMRDSYEEVVEMRGGYGKHVMFLGETRFPRIIRYFIGWLNQAAVKYGGKQVDGIPKYIDEVSRYWEIAYSGGRTRETLEEGDGESMTTSFGVGTGGATSADRGSEIYYDDDW